MGEILSAGTLITWYLVINVSKYIAPFFRVKAKKEKVYLLSDMLETTYYNTRCHNLGTTTKFHRPVNLKLVYHLIVTELDVTLTM